VLNYDDPVCATNHSTSLSVLFCSLLFSSVLFFVLFVVVSVRVETGSSHLAADDLRCAVD